MTIEERLARLEAQREAEMKDTEALKTKLNDVDEKLDQINGKLDRQKGFIAGAMAAFTFVWGVVAFVVKMGWDKFMSTGEWP
jgi:tetrahydromethanopterin S-methyltransferase subunit G